MKNNWIEWIPNISVGQNHDLIDRMEAAMNEVPELYVLHKDIGWDANRTVFTVIGHRESLSKGLHIMLNLLAEGQNMSLHRGRHPRMGALDVCPYVPLDYSAVQDTIQWSQSLAKEIANQFHLPIYLYEQSALIPNRTNLAHIRKGEYEGLSNKLKQKDWGPDFGSTFNPVLGGTVMGVRNYLIAYNVNIQTSDITIAKKIAKRIRTSGLPSRKHALSGLKAIGWYMEEYQCCQISTNIVDIHSTDLIEVFDTVRLLAKEFNVQVQHSELIGLIPQQILQQMEDKWKVSAADQAEYLGLNFCGIDDLRKRTIQYRANLVSHQTLFHYNA